MTVPGTVLSHFLSLSPVLADLRQGDLTASESRRLSDIGDVVRFQSRKSPEVMSKTAGVLRRHGFDKESRLLAGRQPRPSYICLCYVTLHYITYIQLVYYIESASIKRFYSCFCTFYGVPAAHVMQARRSASFNCEHVAVNT